MANVHDDHQPAQTAPAFEVRGQSALPVRPYGGRSLRIAVAGQINEAVAMGVCLSTVDTCLSSTADTCLSTTSLRAGDVPVRDREDVDLLSAPGGFADAR